VHTDLRGREHMNFGGVRSGTAIALEPNSHLDIGGWSFDLARRKAGTHAVWAEYRSMGRDGRLLAKSNEVRIQVLPAVRGASLQATTRPGSSQTMSAKTPAWGEAVDGVQVRLQASERVWKAGEVPTLKADIRNRGLRDMTLADTQVNCELEFDGRWYRYGGGVRYHPRALPRDEQIDGIRVSLLEVWQRKTDKKLLALTPGVHVVRVACRPEYPVPQGRQVVRVVSAEARIEILPGKEPPPAALGWGPAIEGVRCRVRIDSGPRRPGDIPVLLVDLLNEDRRKIGFSPWPMQELCEVVS